MKRFYEYQIKTDNDHIKELSKEPNDKDNKYWIKYYISHIEYCKRRLKEIK